MSFFLIGNSLTHVYAWSGLWLIIQQMSELKAAWQILRSHPLVLYMSIQAMDRELAKSYRKNRFSEAGMVAQIGRAPTVLSTVSSSLCKAPFSWERDWKREMVLRFLSPLSHINLCLSLGCRQVSLKLSSEQEKKKKDVFWQNKVSLWSKETTKDQVQP